MKNKFNQSLFFSCLAGGMIGCILAGALFQTLSQEWNPIPVTGLYFLVLAFCICLFGVISEYLTNHVKGSMWDEQDLKNAGLLLIAVMTGAFVLGSIFQFIYGLGSKTTVGDEIDDYIIMLDNSGSVEATDSARERFAAVTEFVNELGADKQVMVSVYNDSSRIIVDLQLAQSAAGDLQDVFEGVKGAGGTDIDRAIEETLSAYNLGKERTAVGILLSDGGDSVNRRKIADICAKKNVPLFTIGYALSGVSGEKTLRKIAEATGGQYYDIASVSQLPETFSQIKGYDLENSLLGYRIGKNRLSLWRGFLRIIFLTILGSGIGVAIVFLLDSEDLFVPVLAIHTPLCLIAGLIMEFGLRLMMLSGFLRLLMCTLFSVIICFYRENKVLQRYTGVGSHTGRTSSNVTTKTAYVGPKRTSGKSFEERTHKHF